MYLELQTVNDDYARSIVCDAEVNNGGIVKVSGLADKTIAGVKVGRETFKGVDLTDELGDLYAVVAPDVTRDQRYSLHGKTEDDMTIPADEESRCYLFHTGMRLRVEKGIISGTVAVGDKLAPKANSKQLQKAVARTYTVESSNVKVAGSLNVVAEVISVCKYKGRDCYEILFV